jgi:hypothetical protein
MPPNRVVEADVPPRVLALRAARTAPPQRRPRAQRAAGGRGRGAASAVAPCKSSPAPRRNSDLKLLQALLYSVMTPAEALETIRRLASAGLFIITAHAHARMRQRNICCATSGARSPRL